MGSVEKKIVLDIDFLNFVFGQKKNSFEFVWKNDGTCNVLFKKAKLIRDYWNVTGESSSDYEVRSGNLYLTEEQFENYCLKKIKH